MVYDFCKNDIVLSDETNSGVNSKLESGWKVYSKGK